MTNQTCSYQGDNLATYPRHVWNEVPIGSELTSIFGSIVKKAPSVKPTSFILPKENYFTIETNDFFLLPFSFMTPIRENDHNHVKEPVHLSEWQFPNPKVPRMGPNRITLHKDG